ncbi:MAG: hypothetical protein AB2421_19475 [Thermotaleaceae bacterium]
MKKRYKFFSWPVFGQKTTVILVIGVPVILAALGIVANSVEVKSDSYKDKKQPTALESFMIAKSPTHLKDSTAVNIALAMVKGEYYDMNYADPGGGICEENYSEEYELQAYNNVIGAYEKKVYFWNDESEMYERQREAYHIDIELGRRLSTVTPEEMEAAKRVGEDGWETSLLLLAEIPDENIFMYGYNDKDYQGKGVIIQIGENTNYFDWNYCSPRMILPEMYYYDYDNDGRKELAVTLNLGGGTGVSITDLYVLERYDTETLEPFHFRAEDYLAQINERMTYQVDSDKKVIALYDGKNKLREADLTWLPEDARVEGVYYGNIVDFQLGEQLRMKIGPGMEINDWASLQYDGLDDLEAGIIYKNGTFRVTTIE